MIFDLFMGVSDSKPFVCNIDIFREITRRPLVKELIDKYRAGDANAKRQLPAFAFHATFDGKKRSVKNAKASGLVMVDFDKMTPEDMHVLCECLRDGGSPDFGIYLVHVTPSGKGVRIVFRAQRNDIYKGCESIGDFQKRLAQCLGWEQYLDTVTTDLARLSFVCHESDIIYFNSRIFVDQPEVTEFAASAPTHRTDNAPVVASADSDQSTIDDRPLDEVFVHYFALTGGLPTEGNRNARFYSAARDLRYVCDFNPHVLARYMPKVGLSDEEVLAVCTSACQSSRATKVPQVVQDAIAQASLTDEPDEEWETKGASTAMPPLPAIFRPMMQICPYGFEEAALLAMLPIIGTLATGVRGRYLDGELHSPSFVTVITAEQASGKSFARRLVDTLLDEIRQEDVAARTVEAAYREELRRKKNAKELPSDPRVAIRLVPASISVAKLLQRLDYAQGKHLFSFAEELDTVIKSNRSGAWSQKSDIYRNAFDNAVYGQDFMSDNSYSATVSVFYNLLFMGTPRQTRKFFSDVENGLVSRTCFAHLPDGFGQQMPVMQSLSGKERENIVRQIKMLRAVNGEINVQFLHEPLSQWLEQQRVLALKENNRARDIFRKRAAVIGFRAAMCIAPCYAATGPNWQRLKDFAVYMATVALNNQLKFAGQQLNDILASDEGRVVKSDKIYDNLPDEFDMAALTVALKKGGMKTPAKMLVYMWKKNNLIEKVSNNHYKKITENGTDANKV
ncbi:MAG: DUF3987 domain-containing protein [Bacteroidaceae bacterium]|nr:DUF3987 domain-containing protein [Bacteroidaceae bacterium]